MLQVDKQLTRKFELVTEEYLEEHLHRCLDRRELPEYFAFLGDTGVFNWVALETSSEFAVTSGLTDFLALSLPYLAEHFIPEFNLVSLGVGNGKKERILLESLMRIGAPSFYGIDVSSAMIDAALNTVADLAVEKTGLVAFFEDLPIVKRLWVHPVLLCMLGNTVCSADPDLLLATVRAQLGHSDLFLFDCCLPPQEAAEHQDSMVQALRAAPYVRFNTSPLLQRGLEPEAARFVVQRQAVDTPFGPAYALIKHLEIIAPASLAFEQGSVSLSPGEQIRLGTVWRYELQQIHQLLNKNGLSVVERHLDPARQRATFLVRTQKPGRNLL